MVTKSSQHGEFSVRLEGNMLLCSLKSNINRETAVAYSDAVKLAIRQVDGPFFMLIETSEFTGATPEAFEIAEQLNSWINDTERLAAKAVVGMQPTLSMISRSRELAIAAQNLRYFDDFASALDWLETGQLTTSQDPE